MSTVCLSEVRGQHWGFRWSGDIKVDNETSTGPGRKLSSQNRSALNSRKITDLNVCAGALGSLEVETPIYFFQLKVWRKFYFFVLILCFILFFIFYCFSWERGIICFAGFSWLTAIIYSEAPSHFFFIVYYTIIYIFLTHAVKANFQCYFVFCAFNLFFFLIFIFNLILLEREV